MDTDQQTPLATKGRTTIDSILKRTWVLLGVLLVGHFAWLCSHLEFAYSSPDADGYVAQARLIAEEGSFSIEPESPVQYFGMHWLEIETDKFMSRYPAGFPLLMSVPWAIFGPNAALVINPLLATLTLLLIFLICRRWTSDLMALAAAFVFSLNPTFNTLTMMYFSHTASAFALLLGLWIILLWDSNGKWWVGALGGFCLGYLPLVRYAEAVAGIGIALYLLWILAKRPERRLTGFAVICGALVPFGFLMIFNQIHFGAFWKTAYYETGEQSLSLAHFLQNWDSFIQNLGTDGVGLFFTLGLLGFGAMLLEKENRLVGALFASVTLLVSVAYASYYFSGMGNGEGATRFLIPVLPLLLIGGMWFLNTIENAKLRHASLALLVAIQGLLWGSESINRLGTGQESSGRSAALIRFLEEKVPAGSVLIANRRIHEQINFTGKWKLADESVVHSPQQQRGFRGFGPMQGEARRGLGGFGGPRMGGFGGGPGGGGGGRMGPGMMRGGGGLDSDSDTIRPSPMQRGKGDQLRQAYEGATPEQRAELALGDLIKWAGENRSIYWLGSFATADDFAYQTQDKVDLERVSTLTIPGVDPREAARQRIAEGGGIMGQMRPGQRDLGSMMGLTPGQEIDLVRLNW